MNTKNTIIKLHNPKSFAPAVYIPCWLIQISSSLLSHAAKILYGRLAQWSNESGQVYRSVPQLSEEIGASRSAIDRHLKELKEAKLIGTFHPQAGGVNHFEFYDHEWMHAPIKKQLVYKSDDYDPTSKVTLPHVKIDVTPTSKMTCINKKEIERNKKDNNNTNNPVKISKNDLQETYYPMPPSNEEKKSTALTIDKLVIDNPHNIPSPMIEDWITNRKAKKAPITQTVWNKINKELAKCTKPLEAFEEFVAAGWQSFNAEWVNKKHGAPKESYFDNKSTSWGKEMNMNKEIF